MAYGAFITRPWRQQPRGPVDLDVRNPLTQGLTFVSTPYFRNFTRVGSFTTALANSRWGAFVGWTGSVSNYSQSARSGLVSQSEQWTLLAVATYTTLLDNPGQFLVGEQVGNSIAKIATGDGSERKFNLIVRNSAGTQLLILRGNTVFAPNTPFVGVGVRYGASDHKVYVNGVQDGFSVSTVSGPFDPNPTIIGSGYDTPIGLVAGWSRALSPTDIAVLSANPWQLFRRAPPVSINTTVINYAYSRPYSDVSISGWTRVPS